MNTVSPSMDKSGYRLNKIFIMVTDGHRSAQGGWDTNNNFLKAKHFF